MSPQNRYMIGQKLSDYQVEKIIRDFAHGKLASEAVADSSGKGGRRRAPGTVFRIYDLLRRRLLEIGYFPEPVNFFEWTQSSSEIAFGFAFGKTAQRMDLNLLRGASDESVRFHLAEMIFRAENSERTPEAIFHEIRSAIRMTGPLNRPARNVDLWSERNYINICQRHIDGLRRMPNVPADHRLELIRGYENIIAATERSLRAAIRKRSIIQRD